MGILKSLRPFPVSFIYPLLTIRVESLAGPVPIEAFLRAAREIAFVAAEVADHFAHAKTSPSAEETSKSWNIVDAQIEKPESEPTGANRRHSVALQVAPPSGQEGIPNLVRQGVREIATQCQERPEGFSDSALRSLRRVALSSGRKIRVLLSAGQGEGEALILDEAFARHIDGWLSGQSSSVGSVEGHLELIAIHDKMRFTLYGRDNSRVECLFPETMLADVKSALGERVCLRGRIRYRRDGKPATVEARFLKILSPAKF